MGINIVEKSRRKSVFGRIPETTPRVVPFQDGPPDPPSKTIQRRNETVEDGDLADEAKNKKDEE